ncbi:Developmentally-regulated GTP-binding protein 1 [Fragariocoptes setiger]|uniref:inositol oxygenase n=1 Tax=Fragariocoptes setiger TaxID=1670756 RepID=A0ABQ7SB73_9ACAR|nr:Developmentally-regulated GTP-binding protein 1 [Fragariocoptes setiger]
MSTVEKIAAIEAEMARTQRNKATMGHLGLLKARLAKLRRELITPKGGGGGPGEGFDVAKTGDARIGFVGFPSVGKSTLISNLAGVYSEVAAYEFTTLTTVPGVIRYKGAKIQMLDLPGIIEGAKDGKGRGRQVIAVARTCSLIYIVLDVLKPLQHKRLIEKELEGFGLRLNKQPPAITLRKKEKGGIAMQQMVPQSELDLDTIKTILSEYKINNADVVLKCDATTDDLIDVIEGNRIYVPCIYVMNKIDQISVQELDIIYKVPHCVPISAHHKWNYDDLLDLTWRYLDLVRIYTKPKGQLPDYEAPVILRRDKKTVEDFCCKVHRTIIKEFKYALVWGSSVKHFPQKVGKDHELNDEDVVQIVKKVYRITKQTNKRPITMASVMNYQEEAFGQNSNSEQQDDLDRRSPDFSKESECVVMLDPSEHFRPENKSIEEFRCYSEDQDDYIQKRVRQTYRLMHTNQTVDFVTDRIARWTRFDHAELTIMEALVKLNALVDESDPDSDLPNIVHAFQTAERIRATHPKHDWFHLVGLIHDLGKVMALWGEEQWAVVGDTFPVGCAYADSIVYRKTSFESNPDLHNPRYNTKYGIYQPGCGLDNVLMSWGHDEYMYRVLKNHAACKIPEVGLRIIRLHSLYPWHRGGDYNYLCNDDDFEIMPWITEFNKFDLYTKSAPVPDIESLMPYYQSLIDKYIPGKLKW